MGARYYWKIPARLQLGTSARA
eukprot:COSAG01_NODE_62772_length_283_cov_0.554348_2_plen_22_part_01